jgi:hypothetical protein
VLALSDEGIACVDARAGEAGPWARAGRNLGERVTLLIDGLREDDREAGDDIIFILPPEFVLETDLKLIGSQELRDAAYRERVFVAGVVDVLAANPGVSLDSPLLNPYRAYIAPNDDHMAAWRARVDPNGWNSPPKVVFNSGLGFRTVETYALERQEARRAALEAEAEKQAAALAEGGPDVHSKKGASSGAFAKKTKVDFAAVLKPDGTWDRAALEDLLSKLDDEIAAKKADSSHSFNWPGGNLAHVKSSLNKVIKAAGGEGYGDKNGLELAEHFAKELKKIKDACA